MDGALKRSGVGRGSPRAWPLLAGMALAGCATSMGTFRPDYAFESGQLNLTDDMPAGAASRPQRQLASSDRVVPSRPSRHVVSRSPRAVIPPPPAPEPQDAEPQHAAAAMPPPAPAAPAAPRPHPPQPQTGPDGNDNLRASQRVDAAIALLGTPGAADRAFVAHVLRAAGQDIDVDRNVPYAAALHRELGGRGSSVATNDARPGDLVFFHDTADNNGNGKPDDGVTMVGIVERAQGSHVVFIAQRAGKVRRMAVDPAQPLVVRDASNEVVNTRLVRWPGSNTAWTTGQCLTGYARPR